MIQLKKVLNKLKENSKIIVAFILGLIISGTGVYAATILFASNQVSYDNTSSGLTSTDVQAALDEIYTTAKTKIPPCAFKLGDYISLTPTKNTYTIKTSLTGYMSDQTINPSELNLWRVIDIHSDGSFDAVSEYTSSTVVTFKGTTGYANFVGALNTIAAQYQVPGYTIGSRHMGYGGQTSIIGDTSAFDGTTDTPPSTTSTSDPTTGIGEEYSGGVLGDTLYLKDYTLVSNVYKSDTATYGSRGLKAYKVGTSTASDYWLASRRFYYYSTTSFYFGGRVVDNSSYLNGSYFPGFFSGWRDYSYSYAVRPILTLKSGITTSGGSGTKDNPYTIS